MPTRKDPKMMQLHSQLMRLKSRTNTLKQTTTQTMTSTNSRKAFKAYPSSPSQSPNNRRNRQPSGGLRRCCHRRNIAILSFWRGRVFLAMRAYPIFELQGLVCKLIAEVYFFLFLACFLGRLVFRSRCRCSFLSNLLFVGNFITNFETREGTTIYKSIIYPFRKLFLTWTFTKQTQVNTFLLAFICTLLNKFHLAEYINLLLFCVAPFVQLASELWPGLKHSPTITHSFIALLEKKGMLLRNYTQVRLLKWRYSNSEWNVLYEPWLNSLLFRFWRTLTCWKS